MANKNIQPFVLVGLKIIEKMEIVDKKGQQLVMRFAKIYKAEKLGKLLKWHKILYGGNKTQLLHF